MHQKMLYLCIYQIKQRFFFCQLIRRTIRGFLADSKVRDLKSIDLRKYCILFQPTQNPKFALTRLETYLTQPQVAIGVLKDNIYMFFRLPKKFSKKWVETL